MKEVIRKIFQEIDKAIKDNISKVPVPIEDSKFFQKYNKIKEKYLHG